MTSEMVTAVDFGIISDQELLDDKYFSFIDPLSAENRSKIQSTIRNSAFSNN